MAVSDLHGGGLTLQRVLVDDLDDIGAFFHVRRFAREHPPIARLRSRSKHFEPWFENGRNRRFVGRWLQRISEAPTASRLYARRIASHVDRALPARATSRGLICPQAREAMQILEHLKRRRRVAYLTWFMDDHLLRYHEGRWGYDPQTRPLMARHLSDAVRALVISPAMAELYQREFGIEATVVFAPSDPVGDPVWRAPSGDAPCRVAYFGRIWPWQKEALVKFAEALPLVGATLDVFSPEPELPVELRGRGVTRQPRIAADCVPTEMKRYDAVLLATSFSDEHRNLIEFNIATKMSECLASGTVTLLIAPPHSAMARFLIPSGAVVAVTEPGARAFANALRALKHAEERSTVLAAARELVLRKLSTDVMGRTWRNACAELESKAN